MKDLELMHVRTDALFTYDDRGRMQCDNDPERRTAPRVYLAYTADGYVTRFGRGLSDATATQLQEIIDRQPPIADVRAAPPAVRAIREELEQPAPGQESGPTYRFPETFPPSSETVQVTEANVQLARDTYPWLLTELADWWPCFAVVRDGAAISVCFSARIGAVVCEAGVETVPAFRDRGYAAEVTAAWAGAIGDSGRIPVYSTSWDNTASQGVARRLGLIMYGADVVWS